MPPGSADHVGSHRQPRTQSKLEGAREEHQSPCARRSEEVGQSVDAPRFEGSLCATERRSRVAAFFWRGSPSACMLFTRDRLCPSMEDTCRRSSGKNKNSDRCDSPCGTSLACMANSKRHGSCEYLENKGCYTFVDGGDVLLLLLVAVGRRSRVAVVGCGCGGCGGGGASGRRRRWKQQSH